jgi:hypothetical protein
MYAYRNFSSGTVARKNSGYELSLEAKDIQPIIVNFIDYSRNNIDIIIDALSDKIRNMSDEDMQVLSETYPFISGNREDMIAGLKEFEKSVKAITPQELENAKHDTFRENMLNSIDGSFIKYYLGKSGAHTYNISTTLRINSANMFSIDMDEIANTVALDSYSMKIPADFISMDRYKEIVSSIIPPKVDSITINPTNGKAVLKYDSGDETEAVIPLVSENGYNYMPLEPLKTIFNENISWNSEASTPYIDKDGERIEMEGFMKNETPYVKIKDLENLDYMVFWNDYTKEIEIMKFAPTSVFKQYPLSN